MSELIGQTLGRYKVLEEIGRGGMGAIVYKALDTELDRIVAIKILPSFLVRDPEYLERFRREAQATAQLDGPHILNVFDYGEKDGYTYLVMSYISGGTLQDRLGRPMAIEEVVDIISQVGEGLAFAHKRGVVHRDIKPGNILLTEDGQAVIADLGIAKILAASPLTKTSTVIGTPEYMSPEQGIGAKNVDERSDIYALGVMLYEMLTGQVPFQADTPLALVHKHVYEPPPLPHSLNPTIPPAIERVVLKALDKKPEARYQNVEQMVEALCKAANRPVPEWVGKAHVEPPTRRESRVGLVFPRVGRQGLAILGVLAIVCLLLLGGWFAYQSHRSQQAAMHYNRGVIYLNGGSWEVAIYEFDQALAINPGYKDAVAKRAEAQKQLELKSLLEKADDLYAEADWAACIEKLEQIRELDPSYDRVGTKLFDAYHNYGQALVEEDQLSQAVEQFDKALKLNPESSEVQAKRDLITAYLKGVAAYNNGQWEDAIESLAKVYDSQADFKKTQELLYTAYVRRGQELVEAGSIEEGNACCEQALKIRPGGSEASACLKSIEGQQYSAYVAKGNELLNNCKLDEAQAEFEKARAINPDGAEVKAGLEQVEQLRTPQLSLITNTQSDYSSTQGHKNWYYLELIGTSWQLMPWDPQDGYYEHGYDPNLGKSPEGRYIRIERHDIHPGLGLPVGRKWVSSVSGEIKITGTVRKVDTRCGDGTRVRVVHNSQQLWSTYLPYYDSRGETFTLNRVVQRGDAIYFIVDDGGSYSPECDRTYFDASIYLVSYQCK